ncbi:MAG: AAA family ATPase [Eubacterium sp.]|nr:AAA family ATPase [Eubacterium sp.]
MITEDILEWIETLPKWEQQLSYHIIEQEEITDDYLQDLYDAFKVEMKLKEGEEIVCQKPAHFKKLENPPTVFWNGVSNLHGVNRLKTNSKLEISEGLTVIYGENGSGKSGYTRLLNNAFVSRGDREIIPNIYETQPESVSADFLFSINETTVEYKYPNDKEEYAFRTVRNFDSKSASDDMNKESVIDFAPRELKFFDILLNTCIEIQRKLDEERNQRLIDNPILKFFSSEGCALNAMKNLNAHTNVDELKSMFSITKDEREQYERVKKEKKDLISLDVDRQISLINMVIVFLEKAEKKYELFEKTVSDERINLYETQISALKKSRIINNQEGLALFDEFEIEGLGTDDWKNFVLASKKYYDNISNHKQCPLCGHDISEEDLIFKYWKYLESDAETNLKITKEALNTSKRELRELDLSFLVESSVHKQWLLENYKEETLRINDIFKNAEIIRKQVLEALENEANVKKIKITKPDIQELIKTIKDSKNRLNQESINNRISECSKIELEYSDKSKVIELIPNIESYVGRLKWDDLAERSRIKTRPITSKQKELFEKYVTEDYLKTFEEECKKLKANFDIEIVSRGSSGRTLKKLQIRDNVPGRILSEGEQQAIAIASFLTEVQMDSKNIGIVFDDPVCSLDHRRRTLIVKRLLEEAKKRQVIIFTHEIVFFMELKMGAERENVVFKQETIRRIFGEPGNISQAIPWFGMNVRERIGRLKNELQTINSIFKKGNIDAYIEKTKQWCELLRESWERSVEEILFNDAIQRYSPSIETKRLKKAPFTKDVYLELEQGMTDCSAWCHDQARAINANIPSPDDLVRYIECFENYCKKYRV